MAFGISKIYTNADFTFSNNSNIIFYRKAIASDKKRGIMKPELGKFMVDDLACIISKSEEFRTLLEQDANQYRINYGKQKKSWYL